MSFSAQLFGIYGRDDHTFGKEVVRHFEREDRAIRDAVCNRVILRQQFMPMFVPYCVGIHTERLGEVLIEQKNLKTPEDKERLLSFVIEGKLLEGVRALLESGQPPQFEQIFYLKDYEVALFVVLQWIERKKAEFPWPITLQQLIARRDQANFERLLSIKVVADVQIEHPSVQ